MARVWLTLDDVRGLVREELNDDWASMFPDDEEGRGGVNSSPKKPAPAVAPSATLARPQQPAEKKGWQYPGNKATPSPSQPPAPPRARPKVDLPPFEVPNGKKPPIGDQEKRQRVDQMAVLGKKGNLKYAGPLKDPTATKPFDREELRKGVDIDRIEPPADKGPSVVDRLKRMFLKKPTQAPQQQAPRDLTAIRKQYEDYRDKYQQSLRRPQDTERQRHLKGMMQKAHRAWREAGGKK